MVKPIAIDYCHFIKRKVIVYSDIKIGGSNRMGLPPTLTTELNNGAKITSDSSFRKKNGHRTRLN